MVECPFLDLFARVVVAEFHIEHNSYANISIFHVLLYDYASFCLYLA